MYRKEQIRFLKKQRSSECLLQGRTGGRNLQRSALVAMHTGFSYNGGPAALLNKTVCYWHLVFECQLRQPRKIILPLHLSASLYTCILNNLDPYVRTKLCASKYLAFSLVRYSAFWKNSLYPNPLSVFIAHPKYAVFHSNSVEICLHGEDVVQRKTRTLLRFKQ